jgi:multiple sugar transport system substrate-binding protein
VYTDAKTPYNMTRFPQLFGTKYTCQADSHTFVLPTNSGRDAARLERSLLFVKSMLDQSYTWAEGGHIPAWLPTRDSAKYHKLKPQSNYADVADFIHYDDQAWYSGSGSDLEIFMGSAVSAVIAGLMSPSAAISQMRSNLDRYASTPSPV